MSVPSLALGAEMAEAYLQEYPNPSWDTIQTWDAKGYDREWWQYLIANPEQLYYAFRDAGNCKIRGMPEIPFKQLGVKLADKPVALVARTIGMSDIEPTSDSVEYKCTNCNEPYPSDSKGNPPKKCEHCGDLDFTPVFDPDKAQDMQTIRLQDGSLGVTCIAKGKELLWQVKPGQATYALGVLKFDPYFDRTARRTRFRKYVELDYIEPTTKLDITVTTEDKIRFEELVHEDGFYERLLESYAPHLYGMREQKEVAMLTLASQGTARPFNTLIAGPPAKGKTELIKYTIALSPNGHYTAITNATLAGLTSAVEQDPETQTRITKPGMFVMADGGIVGITELQAIRTKEELKISLNDALESKEIASAKADGGVRLQARCAVLIDSNNHKGGWEYLDPLYKNLKFMEPNLGAFLSRLDLISITANETDKQVYKEIAKRNFDSYKDKGSVLEYHKEDWDGHFGFTTLQKYFIYVTSLPLPPLDETLAEKYADNYVSALEQSPEYAVDGRYNRTIALLARVRARVLMKEKADETDLNEAIRLVNASKELETAQPDGTHDANPSKGLPTKASITKKENQAEQFSEAFEKCMKSWEKDGKVERYVKHDELVFTLTTSYGWSEYKAMEYIGAMLHKGRILEEYGGEKYTKA